MKRSEYMKLIDRAKALRAELDAAAPAQSEDWASVSYDWRPDPYGHDGREDGFVLDVTQDLGSGGVVGMEDASLLRLMEIRSALKAWSRNEGDWPLARKTVTLPGGEEP